MTSEINLLRHSIINYPDMAVILTLADDNRESAIRALELGAYGYIIKPCGQNEVVFNVANALRFREMELKSRSYMGSKAKEFCMAEHAALVSRNEALHQLAKAAEFRDNETAQHNLRMSSYCKTLAEKVGLSVKQCDLIQMASQLHDVGKIGIPDYILLKPDSLTSEEFEIVKKHSEIGYMILCGASSECFKLAATIARTHHEKFDGTGYPRGLANKEIPIEGRICAICDVFDVLTSNRVYKPAMSVEDAIDIIHKERGSLFDPELTGLFIGSIDEILMFKNKFADKHDA